MPGPGGPGLRNSATEPSNLRTLEPSNLRTLEPSNLRTLEPSNPRTLEPSNPRTLEPSNPRTLGVFEYSPDWDIAWPQHLQILQHSACRHGSRSTPLDASDTQFTPFRVSTGPRRGAFSHRQPG